MADTARYLCVGGGCPYCLENKSGRSAHPGHHGYRTSRQRGRTWNMPLAKPSGYSSLESKSGIPAGYGDWEKRLPSLCAFLCDMAWSDGSTREPGKLTLWTADSLWKGCLADQAASAIAFLSAQDPSGLLQSMEKALATDKVEWRRSVPFEKRRTRRN